ncbi:MAG: glycosyltransferase [Planctomycetaceae bacterium]
MLPYVLTVFFLLLAAGHVLKSRFIIRYLQQVRTEALTDAECPAALVVLCLRGGDPFLHRSLTQLIAQDYPRYRVRIVVDSIEDEAHGYLADSLGSPPPDHVEVRTLPARFETCSFKMSGILHGTSDLPDDVAVVAFMDGDTVPHSTWLRELAAPIVRGLGGVSTGNRWFFPERPSLGSMCRFWWNAGAVPQMAINRMPWGGTMAVRRDLIEDPKLRECIQHACSEDTSIGQFAWEQGETVHFEPSLLIVNREQIGLRSFFEFDTRQMLFTRLEFHAYRRMALPGAMTVVMPLYPLLRLLGLPANGWTDVAFLLFFLSVWGGTLSLGLAVRKVLTRRNEQLGGWGGDRWFWSILAAFVLPIMQFIAVVRAAWMRRVEWRGVRYRVGGNPRVQVESDLWTSQNGTVPSNGT